MTKRNKHLIYLVAAGGLAWLLTRPKGQPRSSKEAVTPTLGRASAAVAPVSIWTEAGRLRSQFEITHGVTVTPEVARLQTDAGYRMEMAKGWQTAAGALSAYERASKEKVTTKWVSGRGRVDLKPSEFITVAQRDPVRYYSGKRKIEAVMQTFTTAFQQAGLGSNVQSYISGARQPVIVSREI